MSTLGTMCILNTIHHNVSFIIMGLGRVRQVNTEYWCNTGRSPSLLSSHNAPVSYICWIVDGLLSEIFASKNAEFPVTVQVERTNITPTIHIEKLEVNSIVLVRTCRCSIVVHVYSGVIPRESSPAETVQRHKLNTIKARGTAAAQ